MKMKIGLAGAVHPNMPGDDRALFAHAAEQMKKGEAEGRYELILRPDVLTKEEDSEKALRCFQENGADLVLIFCASLPYGRVILPFADYPGALGIWAVPEPVRSGVLQLNSYCGLNMFGAILRNYFPERDVKYKWFYGMPDSELFQRRLRVTLQALRAVKCLKKLRIGQIGGLADGFENLYVDERRLRERLGTRVYSRHTVEEIVRLAESYSPEDVGREVEQIRSEGRCVSPSVDSVHMEKTARISLALSGFAREHRYDALAVSCWSRFQEVYDVAVCGSMSRLNKSGIVAPCEADITSAVAMAMLNAMNGGRASLNDMVALDEEDGSVALWHCGVAPDCWADEKGLVWDSHFNIGRYEGDAWVGSGVVADMNFKGGVKTICTMRNDFSQLFLMTGSSLPHKEGYAGSGGWLGDLKVNGRGVDIPGLINTISVGRVNHHYPAAMGDLSSALKDFAFWTGTAVLDAVPYADYMSEFSQ